MYQSLLHYHQPTKQKYFCGVSSDVASGSFNTHASPYARDIQLQYCLPDMDSAVQEQNTRRIEEWARAMYSQGGETAANERIPSTA